MLGLAPATRADELRPGYLELTEQPGDQWQMAWKVPVTSLPAGDPPTPQIPENCSIAGAPDIAVVQTAILGSARLSCTAGIGGKRLGMPGLLGQADMLVRIQPLEGEAQALRLTGREPMAEIATAASRTQVLKTYFILGVEHILAGWDHLLFVIALVLLIGEWRRVVLAATAFTLAHSITLAAAALGFVGVPQRPVEALIALSIVFLAVEIIKYDPARPSLTARYPWVVAFLFGLLHGFGFAGALSAIGLPQGDIVAALLAFNIGVEAGQLLVVAAMMALLVLVARMAASALRPSIRAISYGIGIIGAYWLLDRTVFGAMA
ncbi:MAG: hypothetical protein B7X57_10955 [Erythrobacter sp. 34-65-8]|nr:MAG: hypothetical protein B7X57_10955 [Erythrobacter sp. 34-65-8]